MHRLLGAHHRLYRSAIDRFLSLCRGQQARTPSQQAAADDAATVAWRRDHVEASEKAAYPIDVFD